MSPKSPKLRAGVGDVASVMSKFFHPSNPILDKYPTRPKNHKLQGVVLVEVDAKVVRQGANAILFFVFTHSDFTDQKIYAAKRYIHVAEEGEEDSLFVLAEAVFPAVRAGGIDFLVGKIVMGEDKNQNCIGPSPHDFHVNLHQKQPPEACGSSAG